ncbi:MAG TPA: hypothetical protein VF255_01045 [Solirubrobacterales bacterium]
MKQIRKRLTYANVMSSLAVFMVLGGAAIAATQLPKNSVGAKQLKKNAVTAAKIKKNAVNGAKVKDRSLKAADFAAGQLPAGPKGDTGAVGPTFGAFGEGGCGDLLGVSFEVCVSTGPVNLPVSGRVLLVASSEWDNSNDGNSLNSGECGFLVDGIAVGPEINFGEQAQVHTIGESGTISMNYMTAALPAGAHNFAVQCFENDGSVSVDDSTLSAVLLGNS